MSRWWESDESRAAAAVRNTRRRLRAGYRGALVQRVEQARRAAERAAEEKIRAARVEIREEVLRLREGLKLVLACAVTSRMDDARNREAMRVEVTLGRELLREAKTFAEWAGMEAVAEQIGDEVKNAVLAKVRGLS